MSGGQQMILTVSFRLAIAEMLSSSFAFLSMDEPTNHLDAPNREQIRDVLLKIRCIAEKGMAILVATHDPILLPACNRVYNLQAK